MRKGKQSYEGLTEKEFKERAFAFQKDLTLAFIDLVAKHNPHPAMTGYAITGLIKNLVDHIESGDSDFQSEFLRTMINDLHDYRHQKF